MNLSKPACKVILSSGQIEHGYCIVASDLIYIEKDVYRLPDTSIYVDSLSRDLFRYPQIKAFVAVPKVVLKDKTMYALYPLTQSETKRYQHGSLTSTEIEKIYQQPQNKAQGTYGKVEIYPTEQIAIKTSKITDRTDVSADMVREIAIYRLLAKVNRLCVPHLYGFSLDKNIQLKLELGMDTLNNVIHTLDSEQSREIMFWLANCLRLISSQGILHLDLKPTNIIVDRSKQVRIIDWGLAEIDYATFPRSKRANKQTLWWKSPELLIKNDKGTEIYSEKADVFSLAVIFVQIWLKRPTWGGENDKFAQMLGWMRRLLRKEDMSSEKEFKAETKKKDQFKQIEITLKTRYKIPDVLADLLSHMFAFNMEERYTYEQVCRHPFFDKFAPQIRKVRRFVNNPPVFDVEKLYKEVGISLQERGKCFRKIVEIGRTLKWSPLTVCSSFQLTDLYYHYTRKKIGMDEVSTTCMLLSVKLYEDYYRQNDVFYKQVGTIKVLELEREIIVGLDGNLIRPNVYSYASFRAKVGMECMNVYLAFYLNKDCYRYLQEMYYPQAQIE